MHIAMAPNASYRGRRLASTVRDSFILKFASPTATDLS